MCCVSDSNSNAVAASARWSGICAAAGFYLLTRIIVLAVALLAPLDRTRPNVTWWAANPLIRWDAGHYLHIMACGYPPAPDGHFADTTAFFPLYPLVSWPVWKGIAAGAAALRVAPNASVAPSEDWTAQLALTLVAHVCGLLATTVFYRWCCAIADRRRALIACMLLGAFPGSFFFSAGYSEGLFTLCVALVLFWSLRQRWLPAALASAAATATRPPGIVVAVVLFVHNVCALRRTSRSAVRAVIVTCVLGLVSVTGLLAHQAFLWKYYGRPDAFVAAQKTWRPGEPQHGAWLKALLLQPVLEPAIRPIKYALRGQWALFIDARNWNHLINLVMLATAIAGLIRPGAIAREWFLLTLLSFAMAWLPDPHGGLRLIGIARYHLAGLPCFLLWAQWGWLGRSSTALPLALAAMMVVQCFYAAGFANWICVS